eukprot:6205406-Amphidinium_carterae.1
MDQLLHHLAAPDPIMNLLALFLVPTVSFVQWDGALQAPFEICSGQLQGSPVASWLFVLCIEPWLRYVSSRTRLPAIVQGYMDDIRFTSLTCRDMVRQFHALVILRQCTGLVINILKTVVLLLGHMSESDWRAEVYR